MPTTHERFLEQLEGKQAWEPTWHVLKVRLYKSDSDPMEVHYAFEVLDLVSTDKGVFLVCSCKGFRYMDYCWHVEDLKGRK